MEKNKEISLSKINKKIIPMVLQYCPVLGTVVIMMGVIHGLTFVANTFALQKFFDEVAMVVKGNSTIRNGMVMAIIAGLVMIAGQLINGIHNFLATILANKIMGKFSKKINDKAGRLDPVLFEDTEFLDAVNKAKKGGEGSVWFFVISTTLVTLYVPYFLSLGIYLFSLDKVLILSLVIIFIPVALTQMIRVKVFDKLEDSVAPIRREYEYYEKTICDREYFKETRILGSFHYFSDLYKAAMVVFGEENWKAEKKTGLLELLMKSLTLLGYLGVLLLLVRSLFKGNITIGAFSAVFASIGLMIDIMEELICRHIGSLTRELGSIRNFIDFFDLKERGGEDLEISGDDGIIFKNVTFKYPSAKEASLKNVNLEIKPKETIAVVGENGAGKSTLVRLMTGLYLPTEGDVLFGEVDTRKISSKSIYKHTSGVFQKYQRYKMELKENIGISNTDIKSDDLIKESFERADLSIESDSFPDGFDTMLSREFDGVDLSGGQWQRVAIARGFYKTHNMIVLDEPTAAIDPVEETKIYDKFASISKGKTSIIVTHRLGSAKIADRIIVMDNGEIAEIGTHEELMEMKGKYAEMYEAQAQWYVREEEVS